MATVTPSFTPFPDPGVIHGYLVTWGPMHNGDVAIPINMEGYSDRSVQVVGTFGAGGNVSIEGSNDGVNFFVLHDPFSNALNFTAAGLSQVLEIPFSMAPVVTAGDGTTALTITLLVRKTNPGH